MSEALAMLDRALDILAKADAASLPTAAQAEALRVLERAGSRQVAVRARVLSAFMAQDGCAADGQGTAKAWLRWQTRVTKSAAAASAGWARRLSQHPHIAAALADGDLSESWAKAICGWTGRLPEDRRPDADQILADAARGGADLADLTGLAGEMLRRSAGPDADGDDGFGDRYLNLGLTWRGAGRMEGDLTPGCAAALSAVVESLGKKAGPEDVRTAAQRRHDALEEACRRLITAGMVPARAGQPTHIQVHMTLSQLRDLPGAAQAEQEWAAARASEPGWLTGPDADAAACDATIIPVVTGHPDPATLDQLTSEFVTADITEPSGYRPGGSHPANSNRCRNGKHPRNDTGPANNKRPANNSRPQNDTGRGNSKGPRNSNRPGNSKHPGNRSHPRNDTGPGNTSHPATVRQLPGASRQRLRRALVALAAGALSGPGGLAARLRSGLTIPELTTPSLPLDIGTATDLIPAHLRRAATTRHRHCAFPGCDQPASACQLHHLIPRRDGGPTSLANLVPLCGFHHLIAIHRWGWQLTLHPDATTTAISPDGTRTLHSHGPPAEAA